MIFLVFSNVGMEHLISHHRNAALPSLRTIDELGLLNLSISLNKHTDDGDNQETVTGICSMMKEIGGQ